MITTQRERILLVEMLLGEYTQAYSTDLLFHLPFLSDFPIQLENPHVIGKHQMTVAVMTKGPDNTVLNSSYQTRFNRDYIMSLGNAIGK